MKKMTHNSLYSDIIQCRLCPRLVHHRETVPTRKCYAYENAWRKPVPGFGDPNAWLLILGLAPSSEGGNRTGRIFTGDQSAKFLIDQLYQASFANQPTSESMDDGLEFKGCYMTAVVKCVPPEHRPNSLEIKRCSQYLQRELNMLTSLKCVLVLGKIALDAYKQVMEEQGVSCRHVHFEHGAHYEFATHPTLFVSYHPSPQNTNTGKLTSQSFQHLLQMITSHGS